MLCRWIVLSLSASALLAQNISSGLSGVIVDQTDSVVPNAEITVTLNLTGFRRAVRTNTSGFFSFPDLTPGRYSLTIAREGFRKRQENEIALDSGEQRSMGRVQLQVGEMANAVTVEESAVEVALGSTDKSGSIRQEELQNLALRGRDIMDAVGLLPGVIDTSDGRDSPSNTSTNNIFISGGRSNAKNVTIDGVTNLDTGSNGSVHSMPSMSSVGEVKVLQSNYAAEYGRNSGGAITIITRGGGKQFHASAGWYHRHESYSANNFFNNQKGIARPPYRFNITDYTVSGPIYIPGRLNRNRSRLFFFWSQEFQQQRVEYGTRTVTVPTALERAGDFSRSVDVNGRKRTIQDPLDNKIPFPGGIVPPSRIHPIGAKVLALFPLPNFIDPRPSQRNQWNYVSSLSGSYPRRTEIVRTDLSPHDRVQVNLRYSQTADEQNTPYGSWVNGSVNFPLTPVNFRQPGKGATLRSTWIVSPTVSNEFVFGVSQNKLYYSPVDPSRVSRSATGIAIAQWNSSLNAANLLPNISFGGVQNAANPSMSDGIPYYNSNTIFSLVDNVSKIAGTHTMKAGVYIERTRKDQDANAPTRGAVDFGANGVNPYDSNYAYSNALMGYFNSYAEATARPQGQYRFTNLEMYIQDAWRARRGLLLDYGVRIYHDMPQYDARGQLYTFVPGKYDPLKAAVLMHPGLVNGKTVAIDPLSGATFPEGYIGTFVKGVGDYTNGMVRGGGGAFPNGLYSTPAISLAPRFGFAWDPFGRGRTAIRGGGGVFFDRIQGNMTMNMLPNPPTIFTPTVYYGTLDTLAETSGQGIFAPTGTVRSMFGEHPMPTTYNFSFGIQQQLGRALLLESSYVGSLTRHSLWQRNINPVPYGANWLDVHPENRNPSRPSSALPGNFLRPYQGYGDIWVYEFASNSNYNSLQLRAGQRFKNGLNYGVSYTFSKVLGTSDNDGYSVSAFFGPRARNYSVLAYDRTHALAINYNYNLPKLGKKMGSRPLGWLVDNWQLSGITRAQSGAPFTPGVSTINYTDFLGGASEPGGVRLNVGDPSAPLESRFVAPSRRGDWGNAGNNILRHPGYLNFDLSASRNIKLRERLSAQLRFETYNTLNHTQYSSVSTAAKFTNAGDTLQVDPLFLQPTAARQPRRIQLALRLNW